MNTNIDMVVPLQKALSARGVEASLLSLASSCAGDLSLNSFARCARDQGLDADVIHLGSARDLSYVAPSAIVAFQDGGGFATIVRHTPSGAVLEDANGERVQVQHRTPTMALELREQPPSGGEEGREKRPTTLLRRLALRLHGDTLATTRATALAIALSIALAGFALAGPIITRMALGSAVADHANRQLTLLAVGIALVGVQIAYVGWLRRTALLYLSTKLSQAASVDVVGHMLRLPFSKLRALEVGTIQQAVSSASTAAEALPTLTSQLVDACLGVGFLALTIAIEPRCGLIVGIAGLAIVALGFVFSHRRMDLRRTLVARTRAQQQALYEAFSGIETVKAENIEGRVLARWLERVLKEEQTSLHLRLQTTTVTTIMTALERIAVAAVLLLMAMRCLSSASAGGGSPGEVGGAIANLVAAVQASASFLVCAVKLAQASSARADYKSDVECVDEILAKPVERPHGGASNAAFTADVSQPALVVRDLWFRYEADAPWVLRGVNLTVQAGERVVLTWPSGTGKSTLLRLLSGLIEPSRGDVLVFGTEAAQARKLITYIPQQATLFPASVMENLRILSGNARPERILAAAEATGLLQLVSSWGMGLDTVISTGVINVSSGQRQLILFTAAVASDTPVVLLDEALAHVDIAMRSKLDPQNPASRGNDLFRGRTVIAVIHDARN